MQSLFGNGVQRFIKVPHRGNRVRDLFLKFSENICISSANLNGAMLCLIAHWLHTGCTLVVIIGCNNWL